MYLSDRDIKTALSSGEISISDFDETRLQPASYDLLLGNRFIINDPHSIHAIDPVNKHMPDSYEVFIEDGKEFVLHPGVSILGQSKDFFGSKDYLIQLGGKSSLARIGLIVHNTAGLINPGHYLNITLELSNANNIPIILRPGMEIAQILFSKLTSPPEQSYETQGRYSKENFTGYVSKNEII